MKVYTALEALEEEEALEDQIKLAPSTQSLSPSAVVKAEGGVVVTTVPSDRYVVMLKL
jgi:hypothetical protein